MHNYVTFRQMTVECECCELPNEFFFKTKHDRVICKGCEPHNGSPEKQQRKLRDHAGLYLSELRLAQEDSETQAQRHRDSLRTMQDQHSEEIGVLNEKIEQLRKALHDGADPAIDRWLADEEVSSAREKRDRAYRARDFAFAAIWQIDRLHHTSDKSPNQCSCGKAQHHCQELGAIKTEIIALQRWEEVQIERLLDGRDHGLPDNHPEVLRLSGTVLGFKRGRVV
ncbi:hypothetical protein [Mycobacteroides chelonae]|uniref:hypothetical protein n=1 Tax=Mycobacteroides chelonae TaxID=1774 RepID=UPI001C2C91C1|nr:hypothetical protein [Mycobacteroides chelonae]MBV0916540.1 hypothetical protein [Mycobacteroides chelonae]